MDRDKAIGLFHLRLNGILEVFNGYGMGVYIPQVKDEIEKAALKLHRELGEKEGASHES